MEQISQQKSATIGARKATTRQLLYWFAKRLFDMVASAGLLVILSPLLLITAIAIVADDGLPIIYRCQRLGRHGKSITVLKFRTMRDGSHHHLEQLLTQDEEKRQEYGQNRKLREDPRRTRVGAFLRRLSIDELPQLVNVLVGEMSLIGPRPYLPDELLGRKEAKMILHVRPGITGLWQVNGRSDTTFAERVAFDVDYIRRRGFKLDAQIALRTFSAVVSGRGAY